MNTTTKTELAKVTSTDITTLPPAARAAVVLKSEQTRKDLVALAAQSAGIATVLNADGREQAHRVGMTLKSARVAIEKTGKAAREDATAFSKAVIAEEKALIALIEPEEERVLSLRDRWDAVEQARKDALIAAERARVEAIQRDIQSIRDIPTGLVLKPSGVIATAIDALRQIEATDERFAEFKDGAAKAIEETDHALVQMHGATKQAELAAVAAEEARKAEAARLAAERAELARLREEQAERERLAKAESDRIAVEQAAEGKRIADLLAAQEAELRRQREADAARIRAEDEARAAAYAEQQAAFEVQRAASAREQEEATQREADRVRLQTIVEEARADVGALPASLDELMAATFASDDLPLAEPLAMPESITLRDALIDAGVEFEVTDEEIAAMGKECGLTPDAWIERLEAFCGKMRVVTSTGQYYSKTTFKENGEPIFLNADGSRSIFCDVADRA